MSEISSDRNKFVRDSDKTLSLTGGAEMFSAQSARNLVSSVEELQTKIRNWAGRTAFPDEGRIQEQALQKSVNKPDIAEWLGLAMDTLDRAVAQINGAMKLESEFSQLKDENRSLLAEKVVDQKVVIDLQNKLIIKNDQEISAIQQTVQSEVRSYASVVQKTCASALAPKVIQTAVKKATVADVRDRNLMFHGMKEEEGENLKDKVGAVFNQLQEKPLFTTPSRVGVAGSGKVRPVKVTLSCQDTLYQILKKSKDLKRDPELSSIYLSRDRTLEERTERRKLVSELKKKRDENPGKTYVIKKNSVICLSVSNM